MTPSPETPPLAVDYSGRPLTEGNTVAFIGTDPVCLRQGHIRVIGPNDLCIESGAQLVVFTGTHAGWAEQAPRPLGGKTIPNEDLAHVRAYPHVALQAPENENVTARVRVGDTDFPGDVVKGEVVQGSGPRIAVDELLAALDRVRAFATRLEEFGENALKDDDRKLYTSIAKDLRARIDGPTPDAEGGA